MIPLLAAFIFLIACSKPEPAPASPSSNAAAVKELERQRDAAPPNQESTVGGDELDRMTVFSSVKPPSTPGNPSHLLLCADLYDKNGRQVAGEGQFDIASDLEFSAGMYVHAPMFGSVEVPGHSSTLGACPAGGELWPDRLAQLRGKTFPIRVQFTSESGKVLAAETSQSF